jgi:hypothetical protein
MELLCDYSVETRNKITFYLWLNGCETTESHYCVNFLCNTKMFRVA